MTEDTEIEADDLRQRDAYDRKLRKQQLQHWHPSDPEYLEPAEYETTSRFKQEVSAQGVVALSQDGAQLDDVDSA